MKSDQEILELAALSRCLHPADPMPGLYECGRLDMSLTEGGRVVAAKLAELATEALRGPAGMGRFRALLFVSQRCFGSGEGESAASAASLLGDLAEELLFGEPEPEEPEEEDAPALAIV